jgi:hypothetical protein
MRRKWTKDEEVYILENHDSKTLYEIAEVLNRSYMSIFHRCKILNLRKLNKYTEDIKNEMINAKNVDECIAIAKKLNISVITVIRYRYVHSGKDLRIHYLYSAMKSRCYNKNVKCYHNYGGRGISVCDEWKNDFMSFYTWAIENGYSEDLTLDRIDVNGDYCPENCRWITQIDQCNNTRKSLHISIFRETKTLAQWSRDTRCKVSRTCLYQRYVVNNMSYEEMLTKPSRIKCKKQ